MLIREKAKPFLRTAKQLEASKLQIAVKNALLVGGSRCISGDSTIDGHTKTIKELAQIGKPILVLTSSGVKIAEAPYKKGEDSLLKFILASGRSIEVTEDHRFWDGSGWIKANQSFVGAYLAVRTYLRSPDQSSLEPFLSVLFSSVQRLKRTALNFLDRCYQQSHQYDRQPHPFLIFDQVFCASQYGELAHNHLSRNLLRREPVKRESSIQTRYQPELSARCSQSDQRLFHQTMKGDCSSFDRICKLLNRASLRISSQFQGLSLILNRSLWQFFLDQSKKSKKELCPYLFSQFCNASNDTPNQEGYELDKVISITRTAKKGYYTLHVPDAEQYFANGILHHNSGKTFITVRNIIIRALKVKSRHLICRLRFNHVKTSIGMDTLPKVMDMCFPDYKLGIDYKIDKTDWYIEFKNGSQIWLTGTDDGDRIDKILGTEYSTIYFNESSQFKDYESISTIMTRLAENSGLKLKAFFDANPPTKKHWLHKVFIEGVMPKTNDPVYKWQKNYGYLFMNPIDNLDNLPADYLETLKSLPKKQQERFLKGLFGNDTEGALWNQQMIDDAHAHELVGKRKLRTVVGVDPAVTNNEDSDHWGIVVVSLYEGGFAHVEADYSIKTSTDQAANDVIAAYKVHEADAVVVEVNQGGDLVENVLRLKKFKGKIINVRAAKGKFARAEPVSALYEQDMIKHEAEGLEDLEAEMMEWIPHETKMSPNRIDALVWAMFELFRLSEKPTVPVYRADFRAYKHVSKNNLLPIGRLPIYIGWGLDKELPAAVIMQKMLGGQYRVLDELVAEHAGLRRFALSRVRALLKTKYKNNKFISVGSPEGLKKQKGSDNERAAFDILWDCGIPTEVSLDKGFEALSDAVRYSMQVKHMDLVGLFIDPRCYRLIEALAGGYHYDDKNKPNKIPLIEAHQYASIEMKMGDYAANKPAIQQHVILDEEMGY